jgi:hypothetical protein
MERRRLDLYEDGVLVLPRARTRYSRVYARPVLVTAALLETARGAAIEALAQQLEGAEAVVLTPASPGPTADGVILATDEATRVLHALAAALEERRALSYGGSAGEAGEALRRLTGVVRRGRALRVHPWVKAPSSPRKQIILALLEGDRAHFEQLTVERGRDDLSLQRPLLTPHIPCEPGLICLDRVRPIQGRLYGSLDLEGDARLGVETRIQGASLRLEVSESGPLASLLLPVGALLGIEDWIPLEASVQVSLAGISVAPRLHKGDPSSE